MLLILVGFALVRAPSLPLPPAGFDSWRETDVLMVGRNFCREHAPIWEPRIDARGTTPGITGMEFPLLNWIQGRAACAGFDQVFAGRLVSLLFALLAIWCVGRLGAMLGVWGGATLAAAFFAGSPLVWYYGRGLQPDVPSLALALLGLVLAARATRGERISWRWTLAAAAAFSLGVLVKLPVLVFALPALVLVTSRYGVSRTLRAPQTWSYALIVGLPAVAWYAHARELQERYGLRHFFLGKPLRVLVADWMRPQFYESIFVQKLFDAYAFPLVSAATIVTLVAARRRVPSWLAALGVATLAYFFLAGGHAEHHFYYGIPATPVLALAAALGVGLLVERRPSLRWAAFALVVAGFAYAAWRTADMHARPEAIRPLEAARERLDAAIAPDGKVLLFSRADPTLLWFLDRKGWIAPATDEASWFRSLGPRAPAVVIDRRRFDDAAQVPLAEALRREQYRRLAEGRAELWVREAPTGSSP